MSENTKTFLQFLAIMLCLVIAFTGGTIAIRTYSYWLGIPMCLRDTR